MGGMPFFWPTTKKKRKSETFKYFKANSKFCGTPRAPAQTNKNRQKYANNNQQWSMYVHACVCVCMHVCACMCMHECVCMCMCVCMHACVYACMCMCTYGVCVYVQVYPTITMTKKIKSQNPIGKRTDVQYHTSADGREQLAQSILQ